MNKLGEIVTIVFLLILLVVAILDHILAFGILLVLAGMFFIMAVFGYSRLKSVKTVRLEKHMNIAGMKKDDLDKVALKQAILLVVGLLFLFLGSYFLIIRYN